MSAIRATKAKFRETARIFECFEDLPQSGAGRARAICSYLDLAIDADSKHELQGIDL